MLLDKKFLIIWFLFVINCPAAFGEGEFVYDAQGKRNPFIPLVPPEGRLLKLDKQEVTPQGGLTVEGIIYDKLGRSLAIVNSAIVAVGDKVGEYQVLKIQERKVVFIKDGELLEVGLTKEEGK